nr:translation initiation factor IF-2-like isoform X2 [Anser cygnoides]
MRCNVQPVLVHAAWSPLSPTATALPSAAPACSPPRAPCPCWVPTAADALGKVSPLPPPQPCLASFPNTEDPLCVLTPEDDGRLCSPLAYCPSAKMAAMSCQHPSGPHEMAAPRCRSAQQSASCPQRWLPSPCRAAKRHVRGYGLSAGGGPAGVWGVRSRGNLVHGGEEEEGEKEAKCRQDVRDGLSRCGGKRQGKELAELIAVTVVLITAMLNHL